MKLSLALTVAGVFVSLMALITWIIVSGRDVTTLLITLPTVVGAIGTLFFANRINNKVDTVKANTNGTLTAMSEQLQAAQEQNAILRLGTTPEQYAAAKHLVETPNVQPVPHS